MKIGHKYFDEYGNLIALGPDAKYRIQHSPNGSKFELSRKHGRGYMPLMVDSYDNIWQELKKITKPINKSGNAKKQNKAAEDQKNADKVVINNSVASGAPKKEPAKAEQKDVKKIVNTSSDNKEVSSTPQKSKHAVDAEPASKKPNDGEDAQISLELEPNVDESVKNGTHEENLSIASISNIIVDDERSIDISNVANDVFKRAGITSNMSEPEIELYIYTILQRNKLTNHQRVINTKLYDQFGQFVYITDENNWNSQFTSKTRFCHLVDDPISAAKFVGNENIPSDFNLAPFRFTNNQSDLIWNPSLPILPTKYRAMEHIFLENMDRFPKEVSCMPVESLVFSLNQSIDQGRKRCLIDPTYAIPSYSVDFNNVAMVLPLRIPTMDGNRPVAGLRFAKTFAGYQLKTVLTNRMVYTGCMLFRDPKYTWLQEVL